MSDGYDYNRHGGDFPTLRDDEVALLNTIMETYAALHGGKPSDFPREHRDAFSSLFLKARNAAAQRKVGPYGQ